MDASTTAWALGVGAGSPTGALALALLAAIAALGAWNLRRVLDPRTRLLSSLLHAGVVLLLGAVVLDPVSTRTFEVARQAETLVLVDDSASMSLPCRSSSTRFEAAVEATTTLARKLPSARFVALDGSPIPVPGLRPPRRGSSPLIERLEQLATEGTDGRIPDRVVLVSDLQDHGSTLSPERIERLARLLSKKHRPRLHAIDLSDRTTGPDASVSDLRYDAVAFYRNVTSAVVEVTVRDVDPGVASVRVEFGTDGAWSEAQEVPLVPGQSRYEVRFRYRPDQSGALVLGARVSLPAGTHESNSANNVRLSEQRVLRDRLRVLHLAGHPSWDVRFLRDALKANGTIDLISFYVMVKPSAFFAEDLEDTVLIPFPTHTLFDEELPGFDLLVFQNFRFGSFDTDQYAERIVDYVKAGGASLVVGGELAFLADMLPRSPLKELFPVRIPELKTWRDYFELGEFAARLTPEGLRHPVFADAEMPADPAAALASLPHLDGANLQGCPLPSTTVLLDHPRARTECGPLPILSTAPLGEGRVALVATDSLWRWAFLPSEPDPDQMHRTLVANLVRWLTRDPTLSPFEVTITTPDSPEKPYRVGAKLARPAGAEQGTWALRVTEWGQEQRVPPDVVKAIVPDFEWKPARDGLYWLELEKRDEGSHVRQTRPFLVQSEPGELLEPSPLRDVLLHLVQASGGTITLPERVAQLEFPPLRDRAVTRVETSRPFSSGFVLALLLALLAGQWYLRSAHGN